MPEDYDKSGGLVGGRPARDAFENAFEVAVNRALGDGMRADKNLCNALWSALANQRWHHDNGDTAGYSFRAAGDLIAAIRGEGDYLDWYLSGPVALVDQTIKEALAKEGWHPDVARTV